MKANHLKCDIQRKQILDGWETVVQDQSKKTRKRSHVNILMLEKHLEKHRFKAVPWLAKGYKNPAAEL